MDLKFFFSVCMQTHTQTHMSLKAFLGIFRFRTGCLVSTNGPTLSQQQSVNDDKALTCHKSHRTLIVRVSRVRNDAMRRLWTSKRFWLSTKNTEYFMGSHSMAMIVIVIEMTTFIGNGILFICCFIGGKKNTFTQIYWMSWSKNEWTRISFSRTSKTIYHRAITPLSRLWWEEKQPKRHTVHHRLGINISPITMYSVLFNNPQRIFCRLCIYWKQPTNVSPSTVQMICLLTFGFCQTNKYKYTKKNTRDRKKYDCFFFCSMTSIVSVHYTRMCLLTKHKKSFAIYKC